jgi:hypothetical protein
MVCAALEWLNTQQNVELSYYIPVFGDDDDQDEGWRVHRVNGGYNDREWTEIGRGQTAEQALRNAMRSRK